jgi:hypothetical protein
MKLLARLKLFLVATAGDGHKTLQTNRIARTVSVIAMDK